MITNKTVGVVLAAYNGEKYIKAQLDSILKQTRLPDYIVITDGGSSDKTIQICTEILKNQNKSEFLILESEQQLDVSKNFARGISRCKTDCIFLCDQDDVWKPEKIETVLAVMQKYEASLVFVNADIVDVGLNITGKSLWDSIVYNPEATEKTYSKGDLHFIQELIKRNVVTGMCSCFDSNIISKLLPFPENVMYDKWLAFVAISQGNVVALNKNCALYRQHGSNQVGTNTTLKKSFLNQKKYLVQIIGRKEMISRYMTEFNLSDNVTDIVKDYSSYLERRIKYISKGTRTRGISYFKYKQYEIKPFQIFVKDKACRLIDGGNK